MLKMRPQRRRLHALAAQMAAESTTLTTDMLPVVQADINKTLTDEQVVSPLSRPTGCCLQPRPDTTLPR